MLAVTNSSLKSPLLLPSPLFLTLGPLLLVLNITSFPLALFLALALVSLVLPLLFLISILLSLVLALDKKLEVFIRL